MDDSGAGSSGGVTLFHSVLQKKLMVTLYSELLVLFALDSMYMEVSASMPPCVAEGLGGRLAISTLMVRYMAIVYVRQI